MLHDHLTRDSREDLTLHNERTTHNVIARARYALPNRCLADDRSLSLALWALLL